MKEFELCPRPNKHISSWIPAEAHERVIAITNTMECSISIVVSELIRHALPALESYVTRQTEKYDA